MASSNVFASLLAQPVKSVQEYDDEREARAALRTRNALQSLSLQQQTDQAGLAAKKRNALEQVMAGMKPGATDDERADAFMSNPYTMDVGDQLRKAALERRKTEADIGKVGADAGKTTFETQEGKRKSAIQQIAALNSPEEAIGLLNQQVTAGTIPMQYARALERLVKTDPKWQVRLVLGINDPKEMLAALQPHMQAAGGALVNTNPLAGPTGQGVPTAIPITQSADNAATQATSRANNAATVGASLANAAAVRDAAKEQAGATRAAANTQRDQATEMKLADDYRAQSKEFSASKSAHEQLTATLGSATTSPAATLAAATKFMKILDPGSVVRESELGMALAASGVIDRAMNYISTLQSGQKLTATQAADFKKISDDMFRAAQRVQQQIDKDYQGKAKAYGLRPEMVTQDLGQNANVIGWGDLK
tara:strand:- start:3102 stop:4373 length:1272 start_codon:yes stop_codon:yes gene_type:complete